jgi:hypothetical protein
MLKPDIIKMKNKQKELPPPPPIFDKNKLIEDINNKLAEELSGSISIKLVIIQKKKLCYLIIFMMYHIMNYHFLINYIIG